MTKGEKRKVLKKKRGKSAKTLELDDRFQEVTHDPLFDEMSRREKKVVVDSRFKDMFTDDRFAVGSAKVDIRGRPLLQADRRDVKALYDLSSAENSDEDDLEIKLDLARGTGNVDSSDPDSSSSSDSEVERENEENETIWNKLQSGVRHVEWASNRLAICNMDWDNIKGDDLFFLLSSFKPARGQLESLSIYLSDFGAERMAAEDREGPAIDAPVPEVTQKDGDKKLKLDDKTRGAIRSYQFDRMKFYYAVAVCDSVETATAIYEACDRVEYESSGVTLDLRFIPDETSFDEDRLKERITADTVNVNKYKANFFESGAIRHMNPKITWDETKPDRVKKIQRINQEDKPDIESDLEDLIAPDSSDDENAAAEASHKDAMAKLFAAAGIGGNAEEEGEGKLQIDWAPLEGHEDEPTGLLAASDSDDGSAPESETDHVLPLGKAAKSTKKPKSKQTPYQEYLERRKEEKKRRKESVKERKHKLRYGEAEPKTETTSASRKRSKKSELAANLVADTTDPRFSALFESADFAIDKTDAAYKGGALAEQQVRIKQERKLNAAAQRKAPPAAAAPSKSDTSELIQKLRAKANKLKKK
uniref:NUC153 domain-containing protein n=1 Tax=Panagrellus redivivus TaxID=6233 RepID=A0A7E4VNA7_PANRE